MSESSFQNGLGGGCGLVLGICRALVLIPIVAIIGCGVRDALQRTSRKEKSATKDSRTGDGVRNLVENQPAPAKQPDAGSIKTDDERLTLANYDRIKGGMPYEFVKEILGPATHIAEPEVTGWGTILEVNTVRMTWNGLEKSVTVTFQNGQVTAKAQSGLTEDGDSTELATGTQAKTLPPPDDTLKKPPVQSPIFRTWTDATGEYSTEAEFRGVAAGIVSLKKRDGKMVKLPLDRLSEEDRQWIEDRARHRTAP